MKRGNVEKSGKSEKRPVGRPPEPVPLDVAEEILNWLHEGRSLRSFCMQKGKPGLRTVYDWTSKDPEFAAQFAQARVASADVLADLAHDVAFDATPETVQVAKLQADVCLKRAACYDPARYGTKAHLEHSGGVSVQVVTGVPE